MYQPGRVYLHAIIGPLTHALRRRETAWRLLSLLIALALLLQPFTLLGLPAPARTAPAPVASGPRPPVAYAAAASSPTPMPTASPTATPVPTVTPPPDPHLPALSLAVAVSPNPLSVGAALTLTLTVRNEAPDPALGLVVTLPVPAGAQPVPAVDQNWTWSLPTLAANSETTLTATMVLTTLPPGGALLAQPAATAQGLPLPVAASGGALVVDRTPASAPYTPGTATLLRSDDGQVQVAFPAGGYSQTLTLAHSVQPPPGTDPPPEIAGFRPGFGAFFLTATDAQHQAVHQFQQPLTLTVAYSAQALQALNIGEGDLTLFWYDDAAGQWVPLATRVDPVAQTASAVVDHFSAYTLGDGSLPSAAFIPSLQGFQVGLYTGNVNYDYPLDLPPGPGGLTPDLRLSYNSAATDGASGLRTTQQASWVGKGWSLHPDYISLYKLSTGDRADSRFFSLVLNGQAFDLTRGDPRAGVISPNLTHLDDWEWHPTDENFIRARAIVTGTLPGRGGTDGVNAFTRYVWQVWAKDGTRYDFQEDAWWGWECANSNAAYFEQYKWYLSQVTDTHGNTVTYTYHRDSAAGVFASCAPQVIGTADMDVWPVGITWGANPSTGAITNTYQVTFVPISRTLDLQYERAAAQIGDKGFDAPHETEQLNAIQVANIASGAAQLIRQYDLGFDTVDPMTSDHSACPGACVEVTSTLKLTLQTITRLGNDGITALPPITFTYGRTRGTGTYGNGNWNRLVQADNGQGGVVSFSYDNIGTFETLNLDPDAVLFGNNRRVTARTQQSSTPAISYTWTYTGYQNPTYNSLGNVITGRGPDTYPNSAVLYFNAEFHCAAMSYPCGFNVLDGPRLAHPQNTEFRGHAAVTETDPSGRQIKHLFYQGNSDDHCTPTVVGDNIMGVAPNPPDLCWAKIRDREFQKGREYDTVTHVGTVGSAKLSEQQHTFGSTLYGNYGLDAYGDDRLVGLWRAFTYETQTLALRYDGGSAAATKTLTYTYDLHGTETYTPTYGNLTDVYERDDSGLLRQSHYDYYATPLTDTIHYIVDRKRADNVLDASGGKFARTVYGYDGYADGTFSTVGDLTLVRKYYDLASAAVSTPTPTPTGTPKPINSTDTSYGYDPYGNVVTATTYLGPGQEYAGNCPGLAPDAPCWSPPGNGSATRTITTTYETTYHVFPVEIDQPQVGSVTQQEFANYDYRMGTLTAITDTNGNVTTAGYDVFGRLVSEWQPGDTLTPTLQMEYHDAEQPFRYVVKAYSGPYDPLRLTQRFYDGLGRLVQTKSQSQPLVGSAGQNIVVDQTYDGFGSVLQASQPRYVAETASTFYSFTTQTSPLYHATSTTYDALGRPLSVQAPDNTATVLTYTVATGAPWEAVSTMDAKGHKTDRLSDQFGRLRQVVEYSGANVWSVYATTTYTYSVLDLLTQVADTAGNNTTGGYDSAGRKVIMTDPDMGTWRYGYDVNGNLITQTSPLTVTTFAYDALDRLTQQSYQGGGGYFYSYDGAGVPNGVGRRTAMGALGGPTQMSWQYDARGHVSQATYNNIAGLTTASSVQWSYDSGNRLSQLTYPDGEQLSYGYDGAWRPESLYSSRSSSYLVGNAAGTGVDYTALDQPLDRSLGNGWTQDWAYGSPMARLRGLQIGPTGTFSHTYAYDGVGNVSLLTNSLTSELQSFGYDHRDRLTTWTLNGASTAYTYSPLGNLSAKGSTVYTYGVQGSYGGPHAVISTNPGGSYSYDAAGNMLSGGGRSYTWTADNQPGSISSGGVTESYSYDGDNERLTRLRGGLTTVYLAGVQEEDVSGTGVVVTTRKLYPFDGQVVAELSGSTLYYLHGDQLGSVALVSGVGSPGSLVSAQDFDPWGQVRTSPAITQTTLNYTGQRLDGTGLLYYHARYYDAVLARWTSPDTLVPGMAEGRGGAPATVDYASNIKLMPLTVDFHESKFASELHGENAFTFQQGFWFQLSNQDQQQAKYQWGPANPQALNRYSYVINNPLRHTDPKGHLPINASWAFIISGTSEIPGLYAWQVDVFCLPDTCTNVRVTVVVQTYDVRTGTWHDATVPGGILTQTYSSPTGTVGNYFGTPASYSIFPPGTIVRTVATVTVWINGQPVIYTVVGDPSTIPQPEPGGGGGGGRGGSFPL